MINNLLFGVGVVIMATLIGAIGALFFKKVSNRMNKNILSLLKDKSLYLGVLLYGLSALIFVFGLKFGELSVLYPVVSLSYVWVVILSLIFLKEKMNDLKFTFILYSFNIFIALHLKFIISHSNII